MKTSLKASLFACAILALGACNNSGSSSGSGGGVPDPYANGWYTVFGTYCSAGQPSPGCDYHWNGQKITYWEDPWWGLGNPIQTGYWQSPDGIIYDQFGNALNGRTDEGQSRDLIGDVAEQEENAVNESGKRYAAQNGLAEDTGLRIARTLHDWASIGKTRDRTAKDMADIGQRLYGVSLDRATVALTAASAGDKQPLVQLNGEIAAYWGTSPETSSAILRAWYKEEAQKLGF